MGFQVIISQPAIEDLKNIARPMPLERFPIDLNHSVSEVVESMQPLAG